MVANSMTAAAWKTPLSGGISLPKRASSAAIVSASPTSTAAGVTVAPSASMSRIAAIRRPAGVSGGSAGHPARSASAVRPVSTMWPAPCAASQRASSRPMLPSPPVIR